MKNILMIFLLVFFHYLYCLWWTVCVRAYNKMLHTRCTARRSHWRDGMQLLYESIIRMNSQCVSIEKKSLSSSFCIHILVSKPKIINRTKFCDEKKTTKKEREEKHVEKVLLIAIVNHLSLCASI